MAWEVKMWLVVFVTLSVSKSRPWAEGAPQVPCYFIFGDSLADDGNNNNIPGGNINYLPYGIDFPQGPTGRFSNGRTTVDIIAQLLGFDNFIPPFLTARGEEILKGVDYASGGAGIRNETNRHLGTPITMDEQLQNHHITISRIVHIMGNKHKAAKHLRKCIYTVGMGSNDYVGNYFMPQFYNSSHLYTPEQYALVLAEQYSQQLRTLYHYGARKVALFGLERLGCLPIEVQTFYGTYGSSCVDAINNAVLLYNARLRSLVDDLNENLHDAKFIYIDCYRIASEIPLASLGFKVVNAPCCNVRINNATCNPSSIPCANRSEYVYWDGVHLTDAMNVILGEKYFNAQSPSSHYLLSLASIFLFRFPFLHCSPFVFGSDLHFGCSLSMACEVKVWSMVFVMLSVSNLHGWASGAPQVPCYFIFGDSLADNGNNNNLTTAAKADYPPYGIDFPKGPTGRFCNGRTVVDKIAELLGFDNYIPPFATVRGEDILKGVNYASSAAGICNESGQQVGARISMDAQLRNHNITVSNIVHILGNKHKAAKYLKKCIYTVGMGSNDYIANYFIPQFYNTSRLYTPEQYALVLSEQYSQQLRTLYHYGARKVALIGLSQLGCIPAALAGINGSSCIDVINNAAQLFNSRLKSLVDDLNEDLHHAKFTYIDAYRIASGIPLASLGFKVTNAACCKVGNTNVTCNPFSIPCGNRSEYVFWDNVHPTEALNVILAEQYYNAQLPSDAYPYDIRHLAQL
ncbi:hypothetical protein L1049_009847 [Liquidambar formosana]|uniref:GDSL esterase/lipase n=1 Tax=Liquidambar formosana TaxID=63359 RepID=A0AAP0R6H9_LIQFO